MKEILRATEAAEYLGLSESTLAKLWMRGGNESPPFVRLGARAVGYRVADLTGWLETRRRSSTSDPGAIAA